MKETSWPDHVLTTLQPETIAALNKLPMDVVDGASMLFGIKNGEPLLIALDGLLRYAKAYKKRFGGKLASDYVLGDYWVDAINGLHGLLNGDGAVALMHNRTTDSKSNSVLEAVYQAALAEAGFSDQGERIEEEKVTA